MPVEVTITLPQQENFERLIGERNIVYDQIAYACAKMCLENKIVYFGQFLVGFTKGWTAPVLPKLQNTEETTLDKVITDAEASWIVSITFIGIIGGLGIIPMTFVGEMFTDTCRGFGGTITLTIGWFFGFGILTAFGYVLPVWEPSVIFWTFSGACALGFFFTVVFVPETKGKSLSEIRELLNK